jgi:hypothetical protein
MEWKHPHSANLKKVQYATNSKQSDDFIYLYIYSTVAKHYPDGGTTVNSAYSYLTAYRAFFTIRLSILKSRESMWGRDSFTHFLLLLD